ncbi:MAG: PqiC family protein [Stellaceae bacterium]
MKWLPALGLVLLVAGCGSTPPTHYYTLDPVAGRHMTTAGASRPVRVAAVHIPAALDRSEIVSETAPGKMDLSDQNRWVSPFGDMARRVLTQDLDRRLPAGTVILPKEPAPPHTAQIVVDVLEFDRDPAGLIVFDGSWSLSNSAKDRPMSNRHFHLTDRPDGTDVNGQVAAMSRLLGQLADQIAGQVSQ